jgi:hypothetical protein
MSTCVSARSCSTTGSCPVSSPLTIVLPLRASSLAWHGGQTHNYTATRGYRLVPLRTRDSAKVSKS